MSDEVIIKFIKERNSELFEMSLQHIVDELSDLYNINIQYQFAIESSTYRSDTYYTALVTARRK